MHMSQRQCAGHPHNKVAFTALEAIHELLPAIPEFWSGQRLWRLIPHLLLRTVDVRDAVRKAASSTPDIQSEAAPFPKRTCDS